MVAVFWFPDYLASGMSDIIAFCLFIA